MTVTAEEAAAVLAAVGDALKVPAMGPEEIRKVVEIGRPSGALHVEVYATVPWAEMIPAAGDAGVSVFQLERSARGEWRLESGSSTPLTPGEDVDAASARLEAQQAWFRPKPIAPHQRRARKALAPMSERDGAGSLAETPVVGAPPRATDPEVDAVEATLGTRFPAGYRTFVIALGEGVFANQLRVYSPARASNDLARWRERIERYWFWGDEPLPQATALECVCIADTIAGDEIVFHPSDPDALFILPRHSERARALGRGLAVAIGKVVRSRRPMFEAIAAPES